jgi:hypothetical protein
LWTPRKGPQVGAECRSCPFAGVAMDLALAIPMIIPRPFAHPVGHGGIARMTATIALPFGGIEPCAARGHVVGHEGVADLPVRMVTDPPALLARVARDDADDGGRCRALGAYWRAAGVDRWDRDAACFFPPRSGTARPPQRLYRSSRRLVPCRSGWFGCAAASFRRLCPSAVYSNHRTPDIGAAAAEAVDPLRLQVALQPDQTDTISQKFAYRKIDHPSMIPRSARWLHMSRL